MRRSTLRLRRSAVLAVLTVAACAGSQGPAARPAADDHGYFGTAARVVTLPIVREGESGGVQETVVQLQAWGEDGVRVRITNSTDYLVADPPIQALLPSPPTFWWWSKYTHPTTTHNSEGGGGHEHGGRAEHGHDGDRSTSDRSGAKGVNGVRSGNLEASVDTDGLITFRRVSDGTTVLKEMGHTFGPVVAMSGASTNAGSITMARQGEVGQGEFGDTPPVANPRISPAPFSTPFVPPESSHTAPGHIIP